LIGWAINIALIALFMGRKSGDPPNPLPMWALLVALCGVSFVYFVGRRVSDQWKSKAVRLYFSPYIAGATFWLIMVGLAVLFARGWI